MADRGVLYNRLHRVNTRLESPNNAITNEMSYYIVIGNISRCFFSSLYVLRCGS